MVLFLNIGALAEIDFSTMSFDELMQAQEQLTSALWNSDGWVDVTIPCGVYVIGSDIPAGRWTITASKNVSYVYTGLQLDETGNQLEAPYEYEFVSLTDTSWPSSVTWNLKDGAYFVVENSPAVINSATAGSLGFGAKEGLNSEENTSEEITQLKSQVEELIAENNSLKEQLSSNKPVNEEADIVEDSEVHDKQTNTDNEGNKNIDIDDYLMLTKGDRGDAVKQLQERLKELGFYSIAIDGDYGNGTVNAIKAFEEYNGMEQTGVASPELQAYLYSDDAKGIEIPDIEISSLGMQNRRGSNYARPTFINHTDVDVDGLTYMIKAYNAYGERIESNTLTVNDIKRYNGNDNVYLENSTGELTNIKLKAGGKYQLKSSEEIKLYHFNEKALATLYMAIIRYHKADGNVVEIPENEQIWYGSDGKLVTVEYENNQEQVSELTHDIEEKADGFDLGFSPYFICNFFAEVADIPLGGVYVDSVSSNSLAAEAGLKQEDIIVKIGDVWTYDENSFTLAKGLLKRKSSNKVVFYRRGEQLETELKID